MTILLTKGLGHGPIASVLNGDKAWGYPVNGICLILDNGCTAPIDEPLLAPLYRKEFELRTKEKKPKVYESEADAIASGDDISFVLPETHTERGPRLMLRATTVGLGKIAISKVNSPSASKAPSFKDCGEQFAIHGTAHSEVLDMDICWTIASYLREQQTLRRGYRKLVTEAAPSVESLRDLEDIKGKIQVYAERLQELWETWRGLTVEQFLETHGSWHQI